MYGGAFSLWCLSNYLDHGNLFLWSIPWDQKSAGYTLGNADLKYRMLAFLAGSIF